MTFRAPSLLLATFALVACDKPTEGTVTRDAASAATAVSVEAPVVVAPTAASSVAVVATPASTTSAVSPAPTAHTTAHAAVDAGKAPEPAPAPTVVVKSASKHIGGNHFALDVTSAGCRVATDCAMTISLQPTGEFHVNKEYPYKFVAVAAPNLTFLGKGDAMTFSRAAGDFVELGEKSATMTVRFKPAVAGDATVSGTYKFSVCAADQCQLEQQTVDLVVPVN